ncbi:MAG: hypothetical protein FWC34_11275 [Bacteroidetes bacterium]|nr:hypothetical protein [Bacteroidota bacterium]MCL2302244.1 hypothetical protein [Lentimicrobiaceae bacterium]MCL2302324.1 hypothetical protein [Lentimicrobiaceae bacterium]
MSRKPLIVWCLISFFSFSTSFIFAREEQVSITDYFLFHSRNQNFSMQAWLLYGSVSLSSQNQFLLKELCTNTLSGNYNINENVITLTTSHFGYSKYGMLTISSGYARVLAKRVSFGLQVHYLLHHVESYPKKHSFTFDLSLYGKITQKIGVGVSAYNPANLKYGLTGNEKIPMLYTLMLDFKLSDKVLLALAASKQLPGFFDIATTICFREKFYGFITDLSLKKVNMQFSFWCYKLQFDVGGSFDYRLGFSPQVGVSYLFK